MRNARVPLTTNVAREAETFSPFPKFPVLPAEQLDRWIAATRVQVVSAIEWNWPLNWSVGPRTVTDSMYFWFASGSGEGWVRNPSNKFELHPGDVMLIPQGVPHLVRAVGNLEPHVYAVHFYANLFGSINLLDILGFPDYARRRRGDPFRPTSERLVREYAIKAPGSAAIMAGDVTQFLHYLLRTETARFKPVLAVGAESELPRLLPALEWIEANLSAHTLTVADLASQVYLSETHFRRLFQQVLGASPVQFIRQRRVDRACMLLRATDQPMKQIAQSCGFAEDAFFSRVFHRLVGVAPAAYRKRRVV